MSSVLPSDRRLLVQFGLDHTAGWLSNAAAIGLPVTLANTFKTDVMNASAALQAGSLAATQAKAATEAYHASADKCRATAASCVRSIKAFADMAVDPNAVYAIAAISPPQPRSHTGQPPARPTDIRAALETNGSITLTWKCANPTGVSRVVYIVQRKLESETDFRVLDFVGEKRFNDATIPSGSHGASYIIYGKAGQQNGPASAMFTVTFGMGGGGLTITSTSTAPAGEMKMAA